MELDFKKSIEAILNDNYQSALIDNFTKSGKGKSVATVEKAK